MTPKTDQARSDQPQLRAGEAAPRGDDREGSSMTENREFTPADAFGLLRSYSRHRDFVRLALTFVQQAIERRAIEHDASKMLDDEFSGFARINAVARTHKFGTPEYKASMVPEKATIDLHFSRNSHHPERPTLLGEAAETKRGLPDDYTYWTARDEAAMTFLDVIEMVCDWWGARLGYADSRMTWKASVAMNLESKGKYLNDWQRALVYDVAAFLEDADPRRAGTVQPQEQAKAPSASAAP